MKMLNKTGLRTEPWGTPCLPYLNGSSSANSLTKQPLRTIKNHQRTKNEEVHCKTRDSQKSTLNIHC